jgi:tetratricopeptide (TPR) repeat protein
VDEHFAISSLAARGDIYLLKKSREKATGDYENAYKNGRNDHAAKQLLKIGKDYEKEGNRDQAIEIYTLLLERHQEYDPSTKQDVKNDHYSESNLTAYLARGDAYYAKGNKESALLDYVAVTDIAYDEELYWTKYGELYKSSIAVYAKLKEKALQALDNYTPVTKEEYFASAKSGDKDALAIIQHRAWEDRYQKWLNARRDTRFAPVRKFFTFPRLTWKSLLWGLALGAVCGLLSIVGIGILIALVFDMTDVSVPAGSALFWIWIALFTVVFLFVWLKRRWLWIALMCLPALFGIYVILGAPGLNRTQAESEPEPVPTEQPAE